MSSRSTKIIVVVLLLLIVGAGVYLWVTTNEEMGGPIENVERTRDEPVEVQDDEVDLPAYRRGDSLANESPVDQ